MCDVPFLLLLLLLLQNLRPDGLLPDRGRLHALRPGERGGLQEL